jgi:hypothetical protein
MAFRKKQVCFEISDLRGFWLSARKRFDLKFEIPDSRFEIPESGLQI